MCSADTGLLHCTTGEYNCFLNVIVQCLWHCTHFRQLIERFTYAHTDFIDYKTGAPCCSCDSTWIGAFPSQGRCNVARVCGAQKLPWVGCASSSTYQPSEN